MGDIGAWLIAQYDDLEREARMAQDRACGGLLWVVTGMDTPVGVDYDPAEVLADLAAKRRIVERHVTCERENAAYRADFAVYVAWAEETEASGGDPERMEPPFPRPPARTTTPFEADGLRAAVRLLASALPGREGYDPAWAVEE